MVIFKLLCELAKKYPDFKEANILSAIRTRKSDLLRALLALGPISQEQKKQFESEAICLNNTEARGILRPPTKCVIQ